MPHGDQRRSGLDADAEFFLEFARKAVNRSFTPFKFATGKFPQAAMGGVSRAQAEQDCTVVAPNDRRRHAQHAGGARLEARLGHASQLRYSALILT